MHKNAIRTFKYSKIENVVGLSDQPVGQLKQNNTLHFIIYNKTITYAYTAYILI